MQKVLSYVFDAISLLKPYDIDKDKVYFGRERDGGYVMADIPSCADVLSFGVGWDVTFESALAENRRDVYLNDHTVDAVPSPHPRFSFEKRGVSGEGVQDDYLAPLSYHVKKLKSQVECTLKMDVEGAEWDVFSTASQEDLSRFDQIVFEGHWLENLHDVEFASKVHRALSNINSQFTLHHVHANNCGDLHIVGGFAVASVLELSYVRTSLVQRRKSQTIFPSVNKANHPHYHDHALLFYPFLPEKPSSSLIDVVRLIVAEEAEIQAKMRAGLPT